MTKRLITLGLLAVLVGSLAGCILNPDEKKVGVRNPTAYTMTTAEIDGQAIPGGCVTIGEEFILEQRYLDGTEHTFKFTARDPHVFSWSGHFHVPGTEYARCNGVPVSVRIDIGRGVVYK